METSSNYAVLVLEQPWWALDEDPEQTSVRHFLDGLSRLTGLPTFFDPCRCAVSHHSTRSPQAPNIDA